jgi:hypothetical protein
MQNIQGLWCNKRSSEKEIRTEERGRLEGKKREKEKKNEVPVLN